MTLSGETLATGASHVCPDCRTRVTLGVYMSNAGYYVGTWCGCGPYSRESGYYRTRDEAQAALDASAFDRP